MVIDLVSRLEQRLPASFLELVKVSGQLAKEQGLGLYLVGGAVRDLLLERPVHDLDLVVEGDAPKLADLLAQRKGGEVLVHRRFGTARLCDKESSIDFVTARAETYAHSGALPAVCPGFIEEDLQRRDFTINAMAINLNPDNFGKLLDPCGGRDDLSKGLIRILHSKSFIDDATRMFRAIRYEQRFAFQLETATEESLCTNLYKLNNISGDRIRHELELILREEVPENMLRRADELGVLKEIAPSLRANGWLAERFREARSIETSPSLALYFSLILYHLSREEAEKLIDRLRFPKVTACIIRGALCLKEKLPSLAAPELSPSVIYRLLEGYRPMSILVSALASESAVIKGRLHLYLDKLRHVRTSLDGEALLALGLSPGPRLGEILGILKAAKLDRKVKTREEEEEFVRKVVKNLK